LTPSPSTRRALIGALVLAATLLAAAWLVTSPQAGWPAKLAARPTVLKPRPTPEPLVPTPLPSFRPTATPRMPDIAIATSTAAPTPPIATHVAVPAAATATSIAVPGATVRPDQLPEGSAATRVGVALAIGKITDYDWGGALPGWYLNWSVDPNPPQVAGTRFAQMVRLDGAGFHPALTVIRSTAKAHPGMLWLIGNEPDVAWQDNATPEQYAVSYHTLQQAIKEADPTAQVAIGGVSQPTPLRMAYLDRILAAYKADFGTDMPVDVWNVHAFILREERGSWGVGIPPGMTVDQGTLYEIGDHANMDIFRRQITDFRRWMADRGLRDKPLIVTEYSILMPASYGFPPDIVASFLVDTFDFFLTARDPNIGYPQDDNRLVQAFNWFSAADKTYPTSNLFDPDTRAVTSVGETYRAYVSALR